MKPRDFKLRQDQSPASNIRRLHSYIRSHQPNYQPATKMMLQAQQRATLRLVK